MRLTTLCFLSQIMKSDEDVRMISAEAPVLFAKVVSKLQHSTVPTHSCASLEYFHGLRCADMTRLLHTDRLVRCSS